MTSRILVKPTLMLVWCALLASMPAHARRTGTLLFEDLFSASTLNSTYWNPYICNVASKGWPWNMQKGQPEPSSSISRSNGNNLDYDLPSLISTGSGLTLTAQKGSTANGFTWSGSVICSMPTSNNFGSGVINTAGYTFQDAYVEVSAKMPYAGNGSWPAIWFLAGPGGSGAEIDLHEGGFLDGTVDPDHVMACNLHTRGNSQTFIDTGVSLSAAYHTYGMEYRQGQSLKMSFDGTVVATYTTNVPTGPYFIILNNSLASSKTASWHSQVNASTASPNSMLVAYVRVYSL